MFGWLTLGAEWSPEAACQRLRAGYPPRVMRVRGRLRLTNCASLIYLPREMHATAVDVSDCVNLRGLPEHLTCEELILRRTNIECLSSGLVVSQLLDAQDCRQLCRISGPLRVRWLNLNGCSALERVPEGVSARRIDLSRCTSLVEFSPGAACRVQHLNVSQCSRLTEIPDAFERLETLNVAGCAQLEKLPDGLHVRSWIDVARSGLMGLPWSMRSVRVLWRGVPISDRVAFDPETITAEEILSESNLTRRQILLDRLGIDRFVDQTQPTIVDADFDAGGERRLLKICFPSGEDLACLQVQCPSTGQRYLLRVPPETRTCKHAAAWVAGYNSANDYQPVIET
jgi:hypothetical protein